MHWAEESEKPSSLLTKTENQRLNWRKPANRTKHQNRKTAIFKSENRKTEPKIGQIRKTENPNIPLFLYFWSERNTNLLDLPVILFQKIKTNCVCKTKIETSFSSQEAALLLVSSKNQKERGLCGREWENVKTPCSLFRFKILHRVVYTKSIKESQEISYIKSQSYRFSNLHILHFRCFILCSGYCTTESDCCDTGYVHFSTCLFISFRFVSFRKIQ